jgi:hypothetical protein
MARKNGSREFVAAQQKMVDQPPAHALEVANNQSTEVNTMQQNNPFSHVQQFSAGWLKLVTESTAKLLELAQVEKLEKQSVAAANAAVDEAGRLAKEVIASAETLGAQWRKAATAYTERALDLVAPKD